METAPAFLREVQAQFFCVVTSSTNKTPSGKIMVQTNQRRLDHEYPIHPLWGLLHPGSKVTGRNPANRQMGPNAPEVSERTPPRSVQQFGSVRQPLDIPCRSHESDPPEISYGLKEPEEFLCTLPLDDNNAVFNLCCRLCSAYERKAFIDGLKYGAKLIQEL